jgi:hypothetical protein
MGSCTATNATNNATHGDEDALEAAERDEDPRTDATTVTRPQEDGRTRRA